MAGLYADVPRGERSARARAVAAKPDTTKTEPPLGPPRLGGAVLSLEAALMLDMSAPVRLLVNDALSQLRGEQV